MVNNPNQEDIGYEEIEVSIDDLDGGQTGQTFTSSLEGMPGIRAIRVVRGGAMISYNPQGVTQREIQTAIERAGFRVDGIEGGRRSPQTPDPQTTKEPLGHLQPPPKVHPDPGGHKGQ